MTCAVAYAVQDKHTLIQIQDGEIFPEQIILHARELVQIIVCIAGTAVSLQIICYMPGGITFLKDDKTLLNNSSFWLILRNILKI